MERLFTLDAQLLFDTVVLAASMWFLFTLLSYLLFNPVRDMLEKRKQRIADEQETARKEKEEALAFKETYEQKLKDADKEVEAILSDARKRGQQNEAMIVAEAKEEANRVMARANAEIDLEKKHALDDMKQEMIQIASMMAEKVVSTSMDAAEQERLLDETLKEMGEDTWQS